MPFTLQNWCRVSASANEPIITLADASVAGSFREYAYYTADTQVIVAAASYFDDVELDIATGDYVKVYSTTDGTLIKYRLTNTSRVITSAFAEGEAYSQTALTNALFAALFTTSIELLPAPGANRMYLLNYLQVTMTYGGAVFTNGGPFHVQYTDTAAGLGTQASTQTAAADINAVAASSSWLEIPVLLAAAANADMINQGLFVAVETGNFTPGASTSTFVVNCSAKIVPTA